MFTSSTKVALVAMMGGAVRAAPASHEVHSLPGWTEPDGSPRPLPTSMYSGFLNVTSTVRFHYVLTTCSGCGGHASTAPLVLWLNGGPGCSSLDGLFYEHGPLLVSHNGTELIHNPHSWSNSANVLYMESPASVGFSYDTGKRDGKRYHSSDNSTAADNLAGLQAFFELFPEYISNDFYVSGESYGGIYVPTLALKIFEAGTVFRGSMKGFLVGNGVFDGEISSRARIPFLFGHGAMSTTAYAAAQAACNANFSKVNSDDPACGKAQKDAEAMAAHLNPYDFYRDCYLGPEQAARAADEAAAPINVFEIDRNPATVLRKLIESAPRPAHPAVAMAYRRSAEHGEQLGETAPCIDSHGGIAYLAQPAVKAALHVAESPFDWTICSDYLDYEQGDFVADQGGMLAIYRKMLRAYRVVVYNGDCDPGCNYLGDEMCTAALGFPVKEAWRPWAYSDPAVTSMGSQTGGWTVQYDAPANGELRFITIKGAGHMAPQWRPVQSLAMFERFIAGVPF